MKTKRQYTVPKRESVLLLLGGFGLERRIGGDGGAVSNSRVEQGGHAELAQSKLKGGLAGVVNGLHAECGSSGNIFRAVVYEEDVGGRRMQRLGRFEVDGRLGFSHTESVRPGAVVEAREPGKPGGDAHGHAVADVGQDASADAGALQAAGPLDHGRVEGAPEGNVGGKKGGKLLGVKRYTGVCGDGVPVSRPSERGTVVVVAELPVSRVQAVFVEAGDGTETGPCGWIGRAREHPAVIEKNCIHASRDGRRAERRDFCIRKGHLFRL